MYRVILQMTVVWNVQNFFKADESTTARVHNMWGSVPICMQFGATYTPVMFELSEHTELVDPGVEHNIPSHYPLYQHNTVEPL